MWSNASKKCQKLSASSPESLQTPRSLLKVNVLRKMAWPLSQTSFGFVNLQQLFIYIIPLLLKRAGARIRRYYKMYLLWLSCFWLHFVVLEQTRSCSRKRSSNGHSTRVSGACRHNDNYLLLIRFDASRFLCSTSYLEMVLLMLQAWWLAMKKAHYFYSSSTKPTTTTAATTTTTKSSPNQRGVYVAFPNKVQFAMLSSN